MKVNERLMFVTMFIIRMTYLMLVAFSVHLVSLGFLKTDCMSSCTSEYRPICGMLQLGNKSITCSFLNRCVLDLRTCIFAEAWSPRGVPDACLKESKECYSIIYSIKNQSNQIKFNQTFKL
uniref:Kazal-like domain-containing protein n=1 Tax=Glossina palpalis gambiensis TaxID=67801 RepID=A0A1B0BM90_9MUSC